MIELKNIRKTYDAKSKRPVEALKGVSAVLPDCGMVFIVGRSGGGKSTLLNILGGLDTYDEHNDSDLIINGVSTKAFTSSDWDSYRNNYIGFIFQDHHLMTDYSVEENINLALSLQQGKVNKKATKTTGVNIDEKSVGFHSDDKTKIENALKTVDLEGYEQRNVKKLSGGQRQRVAIARAIVKDYQVIIADEPTGNLDAETSKDIFEFLKNVSRSKLVIVVSHDVQAANTYADMVLQLNKGVITKNIIKTYLQLESKKYKLEKNSSIVFSRISLKWKVIWTIVSRMFKKSYARAFFSVVLCTLAFALLASSLKLLFFKPYDAQLKQIELDKTIMISKYQKYKVEIDGKMEEVISDTQFLEKDILKLKAKFSNEGFYKMHSIKEKTSFYLNVYGDNHYSSAYEGFYYGSYYYDSVELLCAIDEVGLKQLGFSLLAGEYPSDSWSDFDILIPKYIFEIYKLSGYRNELGSEVVINDYEDILQKTVHLYNSETQQEIEYTIRGVIDTLINNKVFIEVKKYTLGMISAPPNTMITCSDYFKTSQHTAFYTKLNANLSNDVNYLINRSVDGKEMKKLRYVYRSGEFKITDAYSSLFYATELKFFAGVIAIFGVIFAIFGIYLLGSFITSSVNGTKKEIGILRCVGASKKDIYKIYLLEAAIITGLIIIGTLLVYLFFALPVLIQNNFNYDFSPLKAFLFKFADFVQITLITSVISVACCSIPLYNISKKSPAQILSDL